MKKHLFNAIFIAILPLFAGGLLEISGQTVSGSFGSGPVTRGSSAKGTIVLNVPGGLHVNSNRPNSEYAIPTIVRISGAGVKAGRIRYPRGKNRKFQFSENSINVYEGRVAIPFTVNVPANYNRNTVKIRATVQYQACTEEVCYPPRNKDITLTARIR